MPVGCRPPRSLFFSSQSFKKINALTINKIIDLHPFKNYLNSKKATPRPSPVDSAPTPTPSESPKRQDTSKWKCPKTLTKVKIDQTTYSIEENVYHVSEEQVKTDFTNSKNNNDLKYHQEFTGKTLKISPKPRGYYQLFHHSWRATDMGGVRGS